MNLVVENKVVKVVREKPHVLIGLLDAIGFVLPNPFKQNRLTIYLDDKKKKQTSEIIWNMKRLCIWIIHFFPDNCS
jgi:hypothetical protein